MTDNEIIKALECCSKGFGSCDGCPYNDDNVDCVTLKGETLMMKDVLDLINRQKAEIKELRKGLDIWTDIAHRETQYVEQAKSEAYKEFAERLKELPSVMNREYEWLHIDIDNLVKELSEVSDNA